MNQLAPRSGDMRSPPLVATTRRAGFVGSTAIRRTSSGPARPAVTQLAPRLVDLNTPCVWNEMYTVSRSVGSTVRATGVSGTPWGRPVDPAVQWAPRSVLTY